MAYLTGSELVPASSSQGGSSLDSLEWLEDELEELKSCEDELESSDEELELDVDDDELEEELELELEDDDPLLLELPEPPPLAAIIPGKGKSKGSVASCDSKSGSLLLLFLLSSGKLSFGEFFSLIFFAFLSINRSQAKRYVRIPSACFALLPTIKTNPEFRYGSHGRIFVRNKNDIHKLLITSVLLREIFLKKTKEQRKAKSWTKDDCNAENGRSQARETKPGCLLCDIRLTGDRTDYYKWRCLPETRMTIHIQ